MGTTCVRTSLEEVLLVRPQVFEDSRGFFMESYHSARWAGLGLPETFVQDNHSRSARGVLRGLHYQDRRAPMGKLVRCTLGAVLDVAVDIRVDSPTFGTWVMEELSAQNKLQLYCPPGYAHGFLTLTDVAEVQYKCTAYYAPETEGAIIWNDPDVGISWPAGLTPTLSPKDAAAPTLREYLRTPAFVYRGRAPFAEEGHGPT